MAGERYIQKAIDALHSAIDSGIATQIAAVETAQSLTAGTIPAVVDVVKAQVDYDNRSPLIQVYDTGWDFEDQRNQVMTVRAEIRMCYECSTDLEASETMMRRYMDALWRVIEADASLGGGVIDCLLGGGESLAIVGDRSASRLVDVQEIILRVEG